MKPINPEKFSGNFLIWLRNLQWRRKATLGPLKDYQATTAGGPWGEGPRTVAKFHFFKRCKELEIESSFQKYPNFSCQKSIF